MHHKVEIEFQGRTLKLETGELAKQANGAVLATYGKTVVLATAVMSKEPKVGIDFFPLTVDYVEKMYAAGKVPGGFFKREAKPSTDATLTARMIDRPLRPLFPDNFYNDVHIVVTVLSFDGENAPDTLGTIAASAALMISDIPFQSPVGAVNVGLIEDKLIINPTVGQMTESKLSLSVAGTAEAINMVEAGAEELSEENMLEGISFAHKEIQKILKIQQDLYGKVNPSKLTIEKESINEKIRNKTKDFAENKIKDAFKISGKKDQEVALKKVKKDTITELQTFYKNLLSSDFDLKGKTLDLVLNTEFASIEKEISKELYSIEKQLVRKAILKDHLRVDNRALDEIRPISCKVALLPCAHGSGVFTRGETQSLAVTTLGTAMDEQIIDGLYEGKKSFYLHYNFPPFSVGEAGFLRGPGRRELGHGSLAERALLPVIPSQDDFPYTIRLVSEILESNGSSSMASVCSGTLSLMDAGVPIKAPVAGIAMGLIKEDNDYVILTDIQGLEDHLGDMDFKVTGTEKGITALQMDIKIAGITEKIMSEALAQARKARLKILEDIKNTINSPRNVLAETAPKIKTIKINPEKIGIVIGPGGKTIKAIQEECDVKIEIKEDGTVSISSMNMDQIEKAYSRVNDLVMEIEIGLYYKGVVEKITEFGAFISLPGGKSGLLHISEISEKRIARVEDVLSANQNLSVRVKNIDAQGRISLTMKGVKL